MIVGSLRKTFRRLWFGTLTCPGGIDLGTRCPDSEENQRAFAATTRERLPRELARGVPATSRDPALRFRRVARRMPSTASRPPATTQRGSFREFEPTKPPSRLQ